VLLSKQQQPFSGIKALDTRAAEHVADLGDEKFFEIRKAEVSIAVSILLRRDVI
jgi:hypothetical protein